MADASVGLSRRELEREIRWLLRRQPADPSKHVEFVADVLVSIVDANNRALAEHLARGADDLESSEEF